MVKTVGIDLAGIGEHKVRCLEEKAQQCDSLGFEPTPEGLAKLKNTSFGMDPLQLSYLNQPVWQGSQWPSICVDAIRTVH